MWHDLSTGYGIAFTVMYMEGHVYRREEAEGKVLSVGEHEIEISTRFSLKPKQLLYWVDRHKKDNIHFAAVKWCKKSDDDYRAGLSIINYPAYSLKKETQNLHGNRGRVGAIVTHFPVPKER